jgi:oligoribonuclease NrnB/cAMP/cGMP phosphodiesterase (DHH superfamily)
MDKPLVIYHNNCADGFTAAWCFYHRYGSDGCDFYPGVYGETPPDCTGRDVYLVDFSYPRDVVLGMAAVANQIVIIDHHKTAIENLEGIEAEAARTVGGTVKTVFNTTRSGARLAWDFLFLPMPPPQMLHYIEDRDLWEFKLPMTRALTMYVFSFDYTFENWDHLMLANTLEVSEFFKQGQAIARKHMKDLKELLAVTRRIMTIGGYDVPCASLPYTMASDACHIMAEGQPFAACYYDQEQWRVFSLRSNENGIDVSKVAREYGGGGHMHAAGFRVPRNHVLAQS